jgi:hypothetical protein
MNHEAEVEESCAKTREIPRQNDVGENVRTPPSFLAALISQSLLNSHPFVHCLLARI